MAKPAQRRPRAGQANSAGGVIADTAKGVHAAGVHVELGDRRPGDTYGIVSGSRSEGAAQGVRCLLQPIGNRRLGQYRSEEHTSELQSQSNLVCRLLLEKK